MPPRAIAKCFPVTDNVRSLKAKPHSKPCRVMTSLITTPKTEIEIEIVGTGETMKRQKTAARPKPVESSGGDADDCYLQLRSRRVPRASKKVRSRSVAGLSDASSRAGACMESTSYRDVTPTSRESAAVAEAATMPSRAEIDECFGAAEAAQREDARRFIDKYNYDVFNDVPLDGRYKWVKLKP